MITKSTEEQICSESEAREEQNLIDALEKWRAELGALGIKEMSLEEINAEIKAARNEKRSKIEHE